MLFSEPKIPQFDVCDGMSTPPKVSVLFSEPKIPQYIRRWLEDMRRSVSVLFNEPKLLKLLRPAAWKNIEVGFSALQRAEIAEIVFAKWLAMAMTEFQFSSTSRNC